MASKWVVDPDHPDGHLVPLTDAELAQQLADQQAGTVQAAADATIAANRGALVQKAQAALATNQTFLALAAPTTSQAVAQVQALTRECSALIRLLLNALDSTAGT